MIGTHSSAIPIIESRRSPITNTTSVHNTPIAIIGCGCRFPGNAHSPEQFWELIRSGTDAITEVPLDRWSAQAVYSPERETPGRAQTRWGGFLSDIDQFDAKFFGISPREAAHIDPQQRLLLEVAWEAMENAGVVPQELSGSDVGVFIGIASSDYYDIQLNASDSINAYTNLGGHYSIAANRLSYLLDFRGPSMAIDTACSSSLVAVHQACQSLINGESTMALAGGVNLMLKPEMTIGFSKAAMLSPDGRCKSFDVRANGYVRAEGAGVVVLQPLSQALADGHPVLAVIHATVVNQDGRTNGITVPSNESQQAMLSQAIRSAGVSPDMIQYIEAHGTGTPVGDPLEVNALGQVLSNGRDADTPCYIGSVKANIGHLESGSGIAGLIKTVLCLQHEEIPPQTNFETPNPEIHFDALNLRVPRTHIPWSRNNQIPRLAGVNSFGFGGTNAHVLLGDPLTEYTQEKAGNADPNPMYLGHTSSPLKVGNGHSNEHGEGHRQPVHSSSVNNLSKNKELCESANGSARQDMTKSTQSCAQLLPLSARSEDALAQVIQQYKTIFGNLEDDGQTVIDVRSVCYSAGVHRSHHAHRVAIPAGTTQEMVEKLDALLQGELFYGVSQEQIVSDCSKLVFVFPGMGSQWWAMGRQLLAEVPLFLQTIQECDSLLRNYVDWSLLEELQAEESDSRLHKTEIAQPALFAIQIGLARLWQSWGIVPDAIVGHSVGEVAAACVAGALTLEEGVRLICPRSHCQAKTAGQGTMLALGMSQTDAQQFIEGREEQVSIAAINSPASVTLAGDIETLQAIEAELQNLDIFHRFLPVEVPYHSVKMEPIKGELFEALGQVDARPTSIDLYSTVTGKLIDGCNLNANYWWQNVRNPVLFVDALDNLLQEGFTRFIEISPHPVLARNIQDTMAERQIEGVNLPTLRRKQPELVTMLGTLGRLYALGHPIQWEKLYPEGGTFVALPTYPWQRESYWHEPEMDKSARIYRQPRDVLSTELLSLANAAPEVAQTGSAEELAHPLLGSRIPAALPIWAKHLNGKNLDYLVDHRINGSIIFPGAAYVEMALAAAHESGKKLVVEEIIFKNACFLGNGDTKLQLTFNKVGSRFDIYTQTATDLWSELSSGRLTRFAPDIQKRLNCDTEMPDTAGMNLEDIIVRCPQKIDSKEAYQRFAHNGFEYGAMFQGLEQVWMGSDEAVAQLRVDPVVVDSVDEIYLHPCLLDAAFQLLLATTQLDATYLPVEINRVQLVNLDALRMLIRQNDPGSLWCFAQSTESTETHLTGNIYILNQQGDVIVAVEKLVCKRVASRSSQQDKISRRLFRTVWQPQLRTGYISPTSGKWILFADSAGLGELLAQRLTLTGSNPILVTQGTEYKEVDSTHIEICPNSAEDYQRLLHQVQMSTIDGEQSSSEIQGILYLWGLDQKIICLPDRDVSADVFPDVPALDSQLFDEERDHRANQETIDEFSQPSHHLMSLIQTLAKEATSTRLFVVTRNSQAVQSELGKQNSAEEPVISVEQRLLWGVGRVIVNEHPDLHCKLIDLSPQATPNSEVNLNSEYELYSLFEEICMSSGEQEVALRGLTRYVPRVVSNQLEHFALAGPQSESNQKRFYLETAGQGIGNLRFCEEPKSGGTVIPSGQVEIAICATALNFKDVAKATGLLSSARLDKTYSGLTLGLECVGYVSAIGDGVKNVALGEPVMAIAPRSFGTHVQTDARFVFPIAGDSSFEASATLPIALCTAYYALKKLGQLQPQEKVLIHSATGGVGQAAVQLAQHIGAEVFATAGSDEKRDFLRQQGVQHVMNSRDVDFAQAVLQETNGQGVDVILNTLPSDTLHHSVACLQAGGRIIDISNIYIDDALNLQLFQKGISFSAFDLDQLMKTSPDKVGQIYQEAMQYFEDGHVQPLNHNIYPINRVQNAFHYMRKAKHIGKVVVSLDQESVQAVEVTGNRGEAVVFLPERTYLVVGGLRGFGLATAEWLLQNGATHLALVGRSQPSAETQATIVQLEATGVVVKTFQADVTQRAQVDELITNVRNSMPPLHGVFHAATVYDDAPITQLDGQRFNNVVAPKVLGAWHLHQATRTDALDYFVLYSSITSMVGNPWQASYVAANSFLDGLSHFRRAIGLPALTINWGAVADAGYVAQNTGVAGHLETIGLSAIPSADLLSAMGQLLKRNVYQMTVADIDWLCWGQLHPASKTARFSNQCPQESLSQEERSVENQSIENGHSEAAADDGISSRETAHIGLNQNGDARKLQGENGSNGHAKSITAQGGITEKTIVEQVARVLGMSPNSIEKVPALTDMGLDSLMAGELSTRLRSEAGIEVSSMKLLEGISVSELWSLVDGS